MKTKFLKNKNGFLLAEETLKIVIALICISFLVYFLFALYNSNVEKKEKEFAQASLKSIIENINAKNTEVEIFNPAGFYIVSWPISEGGARPALCENVGWENCLCICEGLGWGQYNPLNTNSDLQLMKEDCSDWACEQISKKVFVSPAQSNIGIKIEKPPIILELKDDSENNMVTIQRIIK